MKSVKKIAVAAVVVQVILSIGVTSSFAGSLKDTLKDSALGGVAGGLIGAAVMAFTRHPGQHLDYMGYGAAGGAVVGALYGTVKPASSLAEVENGKVKFAIPAVIPDIGDTNSRGKTPITVMAQLLHGKF